MFTHSKSPETFNDYNMKILRDLNYVLTEMQHQRADLATIKRQLHVIKTDWANQKQVDDYFEEEETPPQTDLEDK